MVRQLYFPWRLGWSNTRVSASPATTATLQQMNHYHWMAGIVHCYFILTILLVAAVLHFSRGRGRSRTVAIWTWKPQGQGGLRCSKLKCLHHRWDCGWGAINMWVRKDYSRQGTTALYSTIWLFKYLTSEKRKIPWMIYSLTKPHTSSPAAAFVIQIHDSESVFKIF